MPSIALRAANTASPPVSRTLSFHSMLASLLPAACPVMDSGSFFLQYTAFCGACHALFFLFLRIVQAHRKRSGLQRFRMLQPAQAQVHAFQLRDLQEQPAVGKIGVVQRKMFQ